jgi:hypothetical protein
MAGAPRRDGVFQRKDCKGWYASYVDSAGKRRKKRVQAHTRTQALDALSALKARAQTEAVLGVKHVSEITTAELMARYKRHQKSRVKLTTFERLDSIIKTLLEHLPDRLKDITKVTVADFVDERSAALAAGTVQKEIATLKHALRLAVEWQLIHSNPADRAKLPRLPEGRTRYLSPPELKAALKAAPEWMRAPLGTC